MSKKGTWRQAFGSFGLALLLYLTLRWLLLEAYVIPSGSMLPTLLIHDYIFVNKIAYGLRLPFSETWLLHTAEPKRGEVVVFRSINDPDYFLIKRVIAVPGDQVEYTDQGDLIINGHKIAEIPEDIAKLEYGVPDENLTRDELAQTYQLSQEKLGDHTHLTWLRKVQLHHPLPPTHIPPGYLLMMGDNRDNSLDSRYWGLLPEKNILGRAMFVWLSCNQTIDGFKSICDPQQIRWDRIFHWIQ